MYVQPNIILSDTVSQSRRPLYDLLINSSPDASALADRYPVGKTVTITGLVEGNSDSVRMTFAAEGTVSAMTDIYAKEDWYRSELVEERSLVGVLRERDPQLSPWGRGYFYTLVIDQEELPIYTGKREPALTPFIGNTVVIVGKLVDRELPDSTTFNGEIWPASIGKITR